MNNKIKKTKRIVALMLVTIMTLNMGFASLATDNQDTMPKESAAVITAAAQVERETLAEDLGYVPGQIIIGYESDSTDTEVEEAVAEQEGEITDTFDLVSDTTTAVVQISDDTTVGQAVQEYSNNPSIKYATPNYVFKISDEDSSIQSENAKESDEIAEGESVHVNDASIGSQVYLNQIRAFDAWTKVQPTSHEKTKVVVLDTGADINHEDLQGTLNKAQSKEVIINNDYSLSLQALQGDGYINGENVDSSQKNSHGTHVAGLIAAQANNEIGIAGVGTSGDNSSIDLVVVDVFSQKNGAYLSCIIEGMEYAQEIGAKVVNMSLGMVVSVGDDTSAFEMACNKLEENGITIVCAAGNESVNDNDSISCIPSDFDSTISVINVDGSNNKAATSNYGSLKDISAPGTNIYSTIDNTSFGYKYGSMSGTSMSAPIVSGVVAMMYSINPSITPSEVRDTLCDTATDIGSSGFDIYTANGLVNADAAISTLISGEVIPKDPKMVGWYTKDGKTYYYISLGQKAYGERYISGHWYHFDEITGGMSIGKTSLPDGRVVYYSNDGTMQYGEKNIGGAWYYFDTCNGAMAFGFCILPDGRKVLYNSEGKMQYGLQLYDSKYYYFDTINGAMYYGERNMNDSWYYFNKSSGIMSIGIVTLPDGRKVLYNSEGKMQYGVQFYENKYYYFDTVNGAMYHGWKNINGQKFYYLSSGVRASGEACINGKWYYFAPDTGVMVIGFCDLSDGRKVYYALDGTMVYGERYMGNHWYYFDRYTGAMAIGLYYLPDGRRVYYNTSGWMLYGLQKVGTSVYYFNTVFGKMEKGEKYLNGHWCYFSQSTGEMAIGWCTLPDGRRVYYDSNGRMLYGEQVIDDNTYYFDEINGALKDAS